MNDINFFPVWKYRKEKKVMLPEAFVQIKPLESSRQKGALPN